MCRLLFLQKNGQFCQLPERKTSIFETVYRSKQSNGYPITIQIINYPETVGGITRIRIK